MDIRARYASDGVVFPIRVLDTAVAHACVERFYAFQQRARERFGSEIHVKPHLVAPWVMAIARAPAVLDAVEQAIGADIVLWCSDFFTKRAGSGKRVGFHQDARYWGLEPSDRVVSAWIALTPSLRSNGCMQVIERSHTAGVLEHRETRAPDNLLSVGQEVVYDSDPHAVVDVELQPGEMSLHHLDLIHGGPPNPSAHDRIGLVLRFVSPDTRQIKAPDSAMLVRGADRFGHFEPEIEPTSELGDAEMARLREVFATRPSGFGGQIIG